MPLLEPDCAIEACDAVSKNPNATSATRILMIAPKSERRGRRLCREENIVFVLSGQPREGAVFSAVHERIAHRDRVVAVGTC